ncbi:N-methyl-L-tryptophan oxidase [Acidisoma sp. S159]|uniref:N-methyl-L-tryptophan oxidase n=1 Tax=Acidisoma sp. S159 TaxID=1747225 RepID=UPI00131CEDBD|nr:N-methyl-L-tryptophan oxidase [Acidisoma sp. S159]
MDADVLVVGCGAMGSQAAWQLASRGRSVIAFEQFYPGHDRGASGGDTRIFRTIYGEGPQYVPLLLEAQRRWRELEEISKEVLLTLTGGLMIGPENSEFIRNLRACVQEYQLPHEVLGLDEARRRFPQHRYLESDVVILDPQAGYLRPERANRAALRVAAQLGATIKFPSEVTSITATKGGVEVTTDDGRYRAPQAIVTVGPWILRLFPEYGRYLSPRRLIQPWFLADNPEAFAPARFPIFCRREEDANFSGFPSIDGGMVKTGTNDTYESDSVLDPDHLSRVTPLADLDRVTAQVTTYLNGISGPPARVTNYADAYTTDLHSILGWPRAGLPVYVMAGYSGHGFKLASAMGVVAADIMIDGTSSLPIKHLSLERFSDQSSLGG